MASKKYHEKKVGRDAETGKFIPSLVKNNLTYWNYDDQKIKTYSDITERKTYGQKQWKIDV